MTLVSGFHPLLPDNFGPGSLLTGAVSNVQQRPTPAIIGGSPDNPVYFPHLVRELCLSCCLENVCSITSQHCPADAFGFTQPGKNEFNVSVEALSTDDDLDKKLAAQSRSTD